jgi:hypothetical protein
LLVSDDVNGAGRGGRGAMGAYRPLYKYLHDRFADRVVLTFGEIEDLIGFPLPDAARLQLEWWTGDGAIEGPSEQTTSWTSANRAAVVNLVSRRVVFDRGLTD